MEAVLFWQHVVLFPRLNFIGFWLECLYFLAKFELSLLSNCSLSWFTLVILANSGERKSFVVKHLTNYN